MDEIFKEIEGYESYQVSNLGRVRSFKGSNERILKANPNKDGRLTVSLYKDGKRKLCGIHRLMGKTFLVKPVGINMVVDHINNDPSDKSVLLTC